MSVWVNDNLEKYAQQIHKLLKRRLLADDKEIARLRNHIENQGICHVDFLGLPYVTTVILYGLSVSESKLLVKVVDNKGISSTFVFELPKIKVKTEAE